MGMARADSIRVDSDRDLAVDLRKDDLQIEISGEGVPFLDLRALHHDLHAEVIASWSRILTDGAFVGGEIVAAFERDLAHYVGVDHAIGVASGTDAIMLALRGFGLKPGDEVITAANTFIATAEAIVHAEGEPVLVDVDPNTATIDPQKVRSAITPRTKFIVPVHLYGQSADMDEIMDIATSHDLKVVEDNAQAIGATYRGRMTGSIGHASATSFYPGKNLGAAGDGGAVLTNDAAVADKVRSYGNHGQIRKYEHAEIGYNSRLDALQAAALSVKLPHLNEWNARRREVANAYGDLLDDSAVVLPIAADDREHVYHLYVVRHPERDAIMENLGQRRIGTGIHYPVPLHLTEPFWHLGYGPGTFPIAEAWAKEGFSIPMGPTMSESDVIAVASALRAAIKEPRVLTSRTA